jgi:hypothetical protein
MTVQQILDSEPRFRRLKNIVNRYGIEGAATFYGVSVDEIKTALATKTAGGKARSAPDA